MKIKTVNLSKFFNSEEKGVIKSFVEFLMKEVPLREETHIHFIEKRPIKMTTGVRFPPHEIYVLTKGRMLIDVVRTLAHEWTHELQHQKMGLPEDNDYPEIGGPVENMANALSGILVKKFQKMFPEVETQLYKGD